MHGDIHLPQQQSTATTTTTDHQHQQHSRTSSAGNMTSPARSSSSNNNNNMPSHSRQPSSNNRSSPSSTLKSSPNSTNSSSSSSKRVVGEYIIAHKLGIGSFAAVWFAHHKITQLPVAIKAINREKLKLNQKHVDNLDIEISVMKHLHHHNLTRLYTQIETQRHIYLVMEYANQGDLARYIRKHGSMSERTAQSFFQQLAQGLQFLHSKHYIHRDLKPQNLLLHDAGDSSSNGSGEKQLQLKIADFGFAREMLPDTLAATLCGSPLYMAPEILRYQKYDATADLWSAGVILYEMIYGKTPFTGANHIQLLQRIEEQDVKFPSSVSVSDDCVDLLRRLLKRQPQDRMTFKDFFQHPFVIGKIKNGQLDAPTTVSSTTVAAEDDAVDERSNSPPPSHYRQKNESQQEQAHQRTAGNTQNSDTNAQPDKKYAEPITFTNSLSPPQHDDDNEAYNAFGTSPSLILDGATRQSQLYGTGEDVESSSPASQSRQSPMISPPLQPIAYPVHSSPSQQRLMSQRSTSRNNQPTMTLVNSSSAGSGTLSKEYVLVDKDGVVNGIVTSPISSPKPVHTSQNSSLRSSPIRSVLQTPQPPAAAAYTRSPNQLPFNGTAQGSYPQYQQLMTSPQQAPSYAPELGPAAQSSPLSLQQSQLHPYFNHPLLPQPRTSPTHQQHYARQSPQQARSLQAGPTPFPSNGVFSSLTPALSMQSPPQLQPFHYQSSPPTSAQYQHQQQYIQQYTNNLTTTQPSVINMSRYQTSPPTSPSAVDPRSRTPVNAQMAQSTTQQQQSSMLSQQLYHPDSVQHLAQLQDDDAYNHLLQLLKRVSLIARAGDVYMQPPSTHQSLLNFNDSTAKQTSTSDLMVLPPTGLDDTSIHTSDLSLTIKSTLCALSLYVKALALSQRYTTLLTAYKQHRVRQATTRSVSLYSNQPHQHQQADSNLNSKIAALAIECDTLYSHCKRQAVQCKDIVANDYGEVMQYRQQQQQQQKQLSPDESKQPPDQMSASATWSDALQCVDADTLIYDWAVRLATASGRHLYNEDMQQAGRTARYANMLFQQLYADALLTKLEQPTQQQPSDGSLKQLRKLIRSTEKLQQVSRSKRPTAGIDSNGMLAASVF